MSDKHYAMVIDTSRCMGCQTCVVSCKLNNQVPGSAHWCHVISLDGDKIYQATGKFPNAQMVFRPILCMHCENPPCVRGCPSTAMHRDETNGIVSVDQTVCIGCGYCVFNCPYNAPMLDDEHHYMSKCFFCESRVEEGKDPFCVLTCPGRARFFGDLNDPGSIVNQLIQRGNGVPWLQELGTKPSVYYI